MPVIRGQKEKRDKSMAWEHNGNCGIMQDNWKLVHINGGGWELYNIDEDRTELYDLKEKNKEIFENLINKYNEWANRVGVVPPGQLPKK